MALRLGLIGHPVSHSLSPPMHRAALLFCGLSGTYELIDLDCELKTQAEIDEYIYSMPELGFSGFNVTIPYKQSVFRLLNGTDEACLLAAANTVRIDSSGQMHAHNTDLNGFMRALKGFLAEHAKIETSLLAGDSAAVVLGAGGAARACIAGLALLGVQRIYVAARDKAKAEETCGELTSNLAAYKNQKHRLNITTLEDLSTFSKAAFSLVVNCTPIGLGAKDKAPDWSDALLSPVEQGDKIFFDTVYRRDRSPTTLMKRASLRGFAVSDGLPMLVEQAVLAFEFWTGRQIHSKHMFNALD